MIVAIKSVFLVHFTYYIRYDMESQQTCKVDFLKRNGSYFAYVPMVKSTGWLGGKLQI